MFDSAYVDKYFFPLHVHLIGRPTAGLRGSDSSLLKLSVEPNIDMSGPGWAKTHAKPLRRLQTRCRA